MQTFCRRKEARQMARKTTKVIAHTIDGIVYNSANDVEYHKELKANDCVIKFTLPSKKDKQRYSRYGAYKCEINGLVFDSVMEGRYYAYLLKNHSADLVSFDMQVPYTLIPGFTDKFSKKRIRPTVYVADFVLHYKGGRTVVIDVKGKKTPEFRIKEKLFKHLNPDIEFVCIQWDSREKEWRNLDDIEKDKRARKRAAKKKKAS